MTHHHAHSHTPGGTCSHHPVPTSFHKAFGIGITLNSLFVAVEIAAGLYAGSLALVADAVHNLGDVLGLVLAWAGYYFARKPANARFTLGFGRISIFATVLNGGMLVLSSLWIIFEAIERWTASPVPSTGLVMVVAGIGIVINMGTALALMRGQHDINIKGAFVHMLGDAAVSAGVIVAALVMKWTGLGWIDPALGILVVGFILYSSWPLLVEGLRLAADGVPNALDAEAIRAFIGQQPAVVAVHDLHLWALSTTRTALSAHVVVDQGQLVETHLHDLHTALQAAFPLDSVTLQLEHSHQPCRIRA